MTGIDSARTFGTQMPDRGDLAIKTMHPARPDATVIIPSFADWDRLAQCLSALSGQTLARERFEVIVANNNSDPNIPADLVLSANMRIIWEPNPGSYAARNSAVEQANGHILFFTDSDCVPDAKWLETGISMLLTLPEKDRIAGRIELFPEGREWRAEEHYDRLFWLRQEDYAKSKWGTTANLIVRRATFDETGPFSTGTFSGGDREWNLRANAIGSEVHYVPGALVRHPARATFDELARKKRRLVGGRFRLKQRRWLRRYLPPLGLLIPSARSLRKIAKAQDIGWGMKQRLMWLDYRLRLVTFGETLRLQWSGEAPERR